MTEFIPHDYQKYSIDWIIEKPYCGLLLDMGLGKTVTTLTALNELKYDYLEIDKALIIAPLKVAAKTWPDEIQKWDHLKHLRVSTVIGSEKQRIHALNERADIYTINRENIKWLVEYFGTRWPFETVVIDELSSFKDSKSQRFRALRKVRPKMERVIGLTGTPAPNGLIDLWPQIYLLDQGERLSKSITRFRELYFTPGQRSGHVVYNWNLKEGAERAIQSGIEDICVSMKSADYLELSERVDNVIRVEMSEKEVKQYKELEKELILEVDGQDITAANAAVLANKLLQLANGAIYDEEKNVVSIHNEKLDALANVIEEAQGEPVLVFYNFRHDLERIKKRFKFARELKTSQDQDDWNAGEIPLLLAHPQSAGHGLNLQQGGHLIVWYSLTWSLEYYQQANARLMRQGQKNSVIVHHLVTKDTMDERVMKALQNKEIGQNELLEAVKARMGEVENES